MVGTSVPGTSRWLALTRLTSPRYLVFTAPAYVLGFLASESDAWLRFWLGLLALVVWTAYLELANKIADRTEDEIDYPERTALCRAAGYGLIARASWTFGGMFVAWNVLMLFHVPVAASLLWAVLGLGGISYSYGPRMKSRTIVSALAMATTAPVLLWIGWEHGGRDASVSDATSDWEILTLVALTFLTSLSAKYTEAAPNVSGDSAIGFRSVYVRLVTGSRPMVRVAVVKSLPFAGMIVAVALGLLPVTGLAVLVFYPVALVLSAAVARSTSSLALAGVRELGIVYVLLLQGAMFLVVHPSWETVALVAGTLGWYVAVTATIHTEPGLLTGRVLLAPVASAVRQE